MKSSKYKSAIAAILGSKPEKIFLYWKGRVALYAVLKAMGVKEGDEIILPAFTCVVVPNAILYIGAKPVYVDIDPGTYNFDINKLKSAVTSKTKVIICQNTFGLSSNLEEINEIAKRNNIYTIEDCTHGFGGTYNGKPNGSFCDAAFYSTQWNKPFSTGIGGFLLVNNESIITGVKQLESEKIKPKFYEGIIVSLLIRVRKYLVNEYTQRMLTEIFRLLSRHNLIIGSSQGNELSDIKIPNNYFKDISPSQIREGLKQLRIIEKKNELRKLNAKEYTQFLKSKGKNYVSEELFNNHLFLKYPLLVKNRELFLEEAGRSKINLGDWFISPLHPIKGNLKLWEFNEKDFPIAVNISSKVVNLPTEIKNNRKVLNFLLNNLNQIE